ncbi:STAS domain-containing protein [Lentzea albidocapillata]|uniref:STAS domain-containing protein n=1 Tax=Lentzea albidocapillata TaxID=40571 RepID=UPI0009FDEA52|nr:STAS domain-containing protein [Lentzea albidocapillata]
MRPLLDLVEPEQLWTVPLRRDHATAARQALRVCSGRTGPARAVVELVGEVDMSTAPLLAERLAGLLAEDIDHVVLDLSGLTFLSAAGVNVLLAADRSARTRGVAISLAGCGGVVRRVLQATGVQNRFDFIDARHCSVDQG